MTEGAARNGAQLYLAYLNFENAFNSVDHEAIWSWLTEMNIPDVDLLRQAGGWKSCRLGWKVLLVPYRTLTMPSWVLPQAGGGK